MIKAERKTEKFDSFVTLAGAILALEEGKAVFIRVDHDMQVRAHSAKQLAEAQVAREKFVVSSEYKNIVLTLPEDSAQTLLDYIGHTATGTGPRDNLDSFCIALQKIGLDYTPNWYREHIVGNRHISVK